MIKLNEIPQKPGIYKLTNKINLKPYVGETCDLNRRMNEYKGQCGYQVINDAIRKHGWENFDIEILHIFDYDNKIERLALEAAHIEFYNSLTPIQGGYGYNVLICGTDRTDYIISEETRKKMSESHKGEKHPRWGKETTLETKEKISRALKGKYLGKDNANFGKKLSLECRKRMSEAQKGKTISKETKEKLRKASSLHKHTEEIKQKMSKIQKQIAKRGKAHPMWGKHQNTEWIQKRIESHKKPVKQINPINNEIVKIWDSAVTASKELNINCGSISSVCTKRVMASGNIRQHAGGFKWEFA